MLNVNEEYAVALLRLMASLPHQQAPLKLVQEQFEKRYRDQIPAAKFRKTQSGRIKWVGHFLWSRYMLTNLGLLDSPARGIWRLSVQGQRWLDEYPTATRIENESVGGLDSEEGHARQNHERRRTEAKPERRNASRTWVAESSNHLDGQIAILEREIETIRAFLDGRNDQSPSDEKKCDWVSFCYTFEMYAEGRDLFRLVAPDGVNPWHFERTRKLAKICELRARAEAAS